MRTTGTPNVAAQERHGGNRATGRQQHRVSAEAAPIRERRAPYFHTAAIEAGGRSAGAHRHRCGRRRWTRRGDMIGNLVEHGLWILTADESYVESRRRRGRDRIPIAWSLVAAGHSGDVERRANGRPLEGGESLVAPERRAVRLPSKSRIVRPVAGEPIALPSIRGRHPGVEVLDRDATAAVV